MKTIGMNWSALALKTPLESEGIGVHTRIITQKKINEDHWEHSQVLILPSGKSEKRFVARLERVKE